MFSLYVSVTKKRPFFVHPSCLRLPLQKQVKVQKNLCDNVEAIMCERKTVGL